MTVTDPAARAERTAASTGEIATAAAIGVLTAVVLAARAPFAPGQLWAEDGTVFLQDALDHGPLAPFLTAYRGYYHAVPRAIGALASAVPPGAAALTTWAATAAVVAWCAATVYLASATTLGHRSLRIVLALSLSLLPALGEESIASSSNLQFLLLFTALVVLVDAPPTVGRRANAIVVVVATAASTPLALALAPVAAWRVGRDPRRRPDALVLAWAAVTALHVAAILALRPEPAARAGSGVTGAISSYLRDVVAGTLTPLAPGPAPVWAVAAVLCLAGLGVVAAGCWRRGDRGRASLVIGVPAVGLATWAVTALAFGAPPRYVLFPGLCLLYGVLVAVDTAVARRAAAGVRHPARPVLAITGLLVVVALAQFAPSRFRAEGPTWRDGVDAARASCATGAVGTDVVTATAVDVPISPIDTSYRRWSVRVSCASLR